MPWRIAYFVLLFFRMLPWMNRLKYQCTFLFVCSKKIKCYLFQHYTKSSLSLQMSFKCQTNYLPHEYHNDINLICLPIFTSTLRRFWIHISPFKRPFSSQADVLPLKESLQITFSFSQLDFWSDTNALFSLKDVGKHHFAAFSSHTFSLSEHYETFCLLSPYALMHCVQPNSLTSHHCS